MEKTIPLHIKKALESKEGLNTGALPFNTKLSFEPILRYWKSQVEQCDTPYSRLSAGLLEELSNIEDLRGPIDDRSVLKTHHEYASLILTTLMAPGLNDSELSWVTSPFSLESVFMSNALSDKLEHASLEFTYKDGECRSITNLMIKACTLILDKVWGYNQFFDLPMVVSLVDERTRTNEYYKSIINVNFVDVIPLEEMEAPDPEVVAGLLRRLDDPALWMETIKPDKFEFQGVVKATLVDVTEEEALSRLKYTLLEKNALLYQKSIREVEHLVRDYFRKDGCRLGITALDYPSEYSINHEYKIRHDFLADVIEDLTDPRYEGSIIHQVLESGNTMVFDDLREMENRTEIENAYIKAGIHSIMLAPLKLGDRTIGLLEVGTDKTNCFSSLDRIKIVDVVPLFITSLERSREEVDNRIDAIIREQYTAIHPSVEWKFVETAYELMEKREQDPFGAKPQSIVFKDVVPLYGQSDISRSSNIRNRAIQHDLLSNLSMANDVIDQINEKLNLPIISHTKQKLKTFADSIELGINSNDEVQIIDFIKDNIDPLFKMLADTDKSFRPLIKSYSEKLDPSLGIVYQERKAYEDSVSIINDTIGSYLDMKEDAAQKILPHYFEKYKTDGVEFDMYVGQSLLSSGNFYPIHLRNMRLWQLMLMCDIARIVDGLQGRLPVPLNTSQLILVHSNPLSIRFRADEKRFDVDGTYNVRYEIIKKRIDKALIMDSNERLTKPGTVSIVYTQDKDRPEYEEYVDFLIEQRMIEPEYDHVLLERTQGVEGLKAFRLYVKLDVDDHPLEGLAVKVTEELDEA